jgi:inorganic pyrophosphatase
VPPHFLHEVAHFFEVYKDLEGMRTKPIGWEDAEAAKQEILRSVKLFDDRFGLPGL